jgi:DMSO/TMAO reductase YedYZ heme-binding membrane subunit
MLSAAAVCGLSALILAVLATAIPTLHDRLGRPWLLRLRNPAAGVAFAYAVAHVLVIVSADSGLRWNDRIREAIESPALLAGYAALLLALTVVLSANRGALRLLGARVWRDVQGSLAVVAALAALHGIVLAEDPRHFAIALLAAAALVWLAFSRARALRDRLRQGPPAASGQALRFYRKRPK